MPDVQIIKIGKYGRSGSFCLSGDTPLRPSAFFFILDLQLRLLLLKSPLVTGAYITQATYFVKGKVLVE